MLFSLNNILPPLKVEVVSELTFNNRKLILLANRNFYGFLSEILAYFKVLRILWIALINQQKKISVIFQ